MTHDEQLMTIQELARYLGVPVGTLYQWRYRREGHPDSGSVDTSDIGAPMFRSGSSSSFSMRTRADRVTCQLVGRAEYV